MYHLMACRFFQLADPVREQCCLLRSS